MINLQLCQCQSQQSPALPVHSPVHNGTKSLSPRPQAQPVSPSPLPQEHPIPACISLQTQRDTEGAHSPSPSQLPWAAWLWRYSQPAVTAAQLWHSDTDPQGISPSPAPAAAPGVAGLRVLLNNPGQTSARHHPARPGAGSCCGMVLIMIRDHQMAKESHRWE